MTSFACKRTGTAPFFVLVAVVVSLQLATVGSGGRHAYLLERLGNSWDDVRELRFSRLLTSSLVQAGPGIQVSIMLLVGAALLVVVQHRVPVWHAIALWFAADAIASISLFVGARLLASHSEVAANYAATRDAGSSSGAHAVITAGLLTVKHPMTRAAAIGLLIGVQIPFYVLTRKPAFIHHIFAITTTVGITAMAGHHGLRRLPSSCRSAQSQPNEVRNRTRP